MFGGLPPCAVAFAEQIEHRGRVLSLKALFHVLRRDHRVVVLGDDAARHER